MSDYDQSLLASAPSISREQKQESYNVALLHPIQTSAVSESAPLTSYNASLPYATHPSKGVYPYSAPAKPWYRNKIVIASGVGLVAVGAIVGGAVGGTVGHHTTNANALADPGSTSSLGETVLPGSSSDLFHPTISPTLPTTSNTAEGSSRSASFTGGSGGGGGLSSSITYPSTSSIVPPFDKTSSSHTGRTALPGTSADVTTHLSPGRLGVSSAPISLATGGDPITGPSQSHGYA